MQYALLPLVYRLTKVLFACSTTMQYVLLPLVYAQGFFFFGVLVFCVFFTCAGVSRGFVFLLFIYRVFLLRSHFCGLGLLVFKVFDHSFAFLGLCEILHC